jgi:hypothetical protein
MTDTHKSQVVSPTSQKKSTVLTALVAFADVVLAVLANQFFQGAVWVVVVVVAGLVFVVLTVLNVRAENGERILTWRQIHKIVTARIFVAFVAAAVAAGVTYFVMDRTNAADVKNSQDNGSVVVASSPTTTAATSAATTSPTRTTAGGCDLKVGEAGVVEVEAQTGAPSDLTFCPALLNNGAPITGPFTLAGKIIGAADRYRDLLIVNRADPETCDALGNRPAAGYYYARGMTIDADGNWSFRDGLGYDEAVTIGRTYSFISGPAAAIAAIKNDRQAFADAHGGSDDEYAGMETLPTTARVVATFRQAPGKYKGKGSPCKNS